MKLFRTCLLLLLSLLLPVQAALAAGAAGCLRHVSPELLTSAMATAAAADDAADEAVAQGHSACAEHATAAPGATKATDGSQGAEGDAGCNSCGLCGLASAMPGQGPLWQTSRLQQAHAATSGAALLSTVGRTLDRPPRASAAAR